MLRTAFVYMKLNLKLDALHSPKIYFPGISFIYITGFGLFSLLPYPINLF